MLRGWLLVVLLPLAIAGALVASLFWFLLGRTPPRFRPIFLLILVLCILLPYGLHAIGTMGYVSSFGPPAQEPYATYRGLQLYGAFTLLSLGLLTVVAALAVSRRPATVAVIPALMWSAYWWGIIPLLQFQAPEYVAIDNVPLIWLFTASLVAIPVLLAGAVRLARLRGEGTRNARLDASIDVHEGHRGF